MALSPNRLAACAGFALLYVALYALSDVLSGNLAVGGIASVFFLPAFVRLLGFLLIGAWIVPSLALAGVGLVLAGAYDIGPGIAAELTVTAFTAIGGPLAVLAASRLTRLEPSLSNLTPPRLLLLSAACAGGNALAYRVGLEMAGLEKASLTGDLAVFAGDLAGTWAIVYLLKTALTLHGRIAHR